MQSSSDWILLGFERLSHAAAGVNVSLQIFTAGGGVFLRVRTSAFWCQQMTRTAGFSLQSVVDPSSFIKVHVLTVSSKIFDE